MFITLKTLFLSIFPGRILWHLILQRTIWVILVHNVVICLLHSFKLSSKFLKTLTYLLTHLCELLTSWEIINTWYLYTNREEIKMPIPMQYPLAIGTAAERSGEGCPRFYKQVEVPKRALGNLWRSTIAPLFMILFPCVFPCVFSIWTKWFQTHASCSSPLWKILKEIGSFHVKYSLISPLLFSN